MYKYFLVAFMILIVILPCCARSANEINPALGEKFTLSIGQSASIKGEDIKVRFIEVVGDSRCPQDVTCIWAGEVTSLIEISLSGATYQKALTQPGLSEPPQADFQNYVIVFDLQPYPRAEVPIENKDYRLQLEFRKKSG
jgi:hypothetical protein